VPVAVNCLVLPTGRLGLAGVTAMEDRVARVTVRVVLPEIAPEVAVMVEVPAATAVARPLLLTVATDVLDELQVTCVVISWLVPSEYVPVAANCIVLPTGRLGLAGVTAMEVAAGAGPPPPPPPPPHPVSANTNANKHKIKTLNLLFSMPTLLFYISRTLYLGPYLLLIVTHVSGTFFYSYPQFIHLGGNGVDRRLSA